MKAQVLRNRRRSALALPKFWRPKITTGQMLDARIVHNDLVDRLAHGTATVGDLWDWMETGFTYSQMMRLLHADGVAFTVEAEIAIVLQLDSYEGICERLRRTGKVGLSGPELTTAKAASAVMDELIALDRHGIAVRAAEWSEQQMARLRGGVR